MEPLRVLQVFTIMNPGGAETMVMNYYRNIDRNKIQFDFLVHRPNIKGFYDDEIKSLGGNIYAVNPINIFYPKKYYQQLRAFFRSHNTYTIIHSHINTFSCFPLRIAEEFGVSTRIAHAHTALPKVKLKDFFKKGKGVQSLKTVIKFRLKNKIHQHTTHCFSCGDKAGKWLFGEKANFRIINNAINASNFSYNETTAKQYKQENHLQDRLVVGHIGNFSEPKNYPFIMAVFYELQKMHHNSSLVLIGDGEFRKDTEVKAKKLNISEKVCFLGVRNDIPNLCKMLDIFLFPSFFEGLPVTLIEAQAADLKILASDSITKKVKISDNLLFLSINDSPKKWAQKIIDMYPYKRTNKMALIKKCGYDINQNAILLKEFYLNQK